MMEEVSLSPTQMVPERPFVDPENSEEDLATMRDMAHQLVDTYDDPVLCDFVPGKRAICQSDPKGRHFRIYYIRPALLFSAKNLTVVGFFGNARPAANIRPLIRADKRFENEFHNHPGLLSLSTVRMPNGNFGNLVLFTNTEAKDNWNHNKVHWETVARISPPYYESIRLNNAVLPHGLDDPDELELVRVKYLDYSSDTPWRAVRDLNQ